MSGDTDKIRLRSRLLVYAAFVLFWMFLYSSPPGDDLSSSYIACKLIEEGDWASVYDYHPKLFHVVDSDAWHQAAKQADFKGFLHPYVQIPLWAWMLQPLCASLKFQSFSLLFLAVNLISFVFMVEFAARFWAKNFKSWQWMIALLLAVSITTPFKYSLWLVQTHSIFMALALASVVCANKNQSKVAGFMLAVAASIKLSPAFLIFYWGAKRQYLAILWFFIGALAIALLSFGLVGLDINLIFLKNIINRVANTLLVSFNNQSLAAWWVYGPNMESELLDWKSLDLPSYLKFFGAALSAVLLILVGVMERVFGKTSLQQGATACISVLVITAFSPIAWTHYYIVLVPAAMVLMQARLTLFKLLVLLIFLLNVEPIAIDPMAPRITSITIIRSQFFAAVLAMVALYVCFFTRSGSGSNLDALD